MPLNAIEALLHESMGLHSSTVGSNTVHQAVKVRMRACDIGTAGEYLALITRSPAELDSLIEAVVIPETWFFRDNNPFVTFSNWITEQKGRFTSAAPLRVLSIPCSSGEEPYTLAMCLADCNVAVDHARIDAVDISQKHLDKALEAKYGSNSFRSTDLLYRNRHFDAAGDQYRLKAEIRERVSFARGNLLDQGFIATLSQYHVIFCRNLLIYFDRATQQLAIDRLNTLLVPDGLLFVGHSETCLLRNRGFAALEHSRCFGFRQETSGSRVMDTPGSRPSARTRPERQVLRRTRAHSDRSPCSCPEQSTPARQEPEQQPMGNPIQRAFQLANEGHLDEAALICEPLLRHATYQADAYYLLGLVREAAGNSEEAERLFRKAVYLTPAHAEALIHLGAIASRRGDQQRAQRLKERAARAQAATNSSQVKG